MKRVIIVGKTGSGKTSLGREISKLTGIPHLEIDALYWGPNWQPVDLKMFRDRVHACVQCDAWVMDGNYGKVRDLTWTRADTLIWLDYPLWLTWWRLLRRTVARAVSHEDLWLTGNRETFRDQFFSRDSLFLYAVKTHRRHRKEYPALFKEPQYEHLRVIRFRSPVQACDWLTTLVASE